MKYSFSLIFLYNFNVVFPLFDNAFKPFFGIPIAYKLKERTKMNSIYKINKNTLYASNKRAKLITLLLLLTMTITIVPLSTINNVHAELTWYPYVTASPNPVGVGQQVLVVFGFTMPTMSSYNDWTLTITDPDGNVKTETGLDTETTGSTFYTFTPDKAGNWTIKAHYPGGSAILNGNEEVSIAAADTTVFKLNVQEEPVSAYPDTPLPNAYWEFPIYGENHNWNLIAGNWLMSGYDRSRDFDSGAGAFNPYTTVPNSGHILWTKSQLFGGTVGGNTSMTYYEGHSYRRELMPPVIMNGRLYYTVQERPGEGFYCVDLASGETIWFNNASYPDGAGGVIAGYQAGISLGTVLTLDTMNWHGGLPMLWSCGKLPWEVAVPTWAVWNAYDGKLMFTIVNTQTPMNMYGDFYVDEKTGTLMSVIYDNINDRLLVWNSTRMFDNQLGIGWFPGIFGMNSPQYNLDWNAGVQLNATISHINVPMSDQYIVQFDPKDPSVVIINTQAQASVEAGAPFFETAFSLTDGRMLWNKTRNIGTWESIVGGRAISVSDDCYAIYRKETMQVYAYSVSTGEQKWVSEPRDNQWGMYMQGMNFAYGKLCVIGYDGMVYTYDAKTGKELWTWGPVSSGLETPYGVYPLYGGSVAADHKLIVANGEHSSNSPLYRGERMYVLNTTDGTTLWSADGWYQQPSAANGVIVAPNGYDGNIYCFGRGPSSTTVTAPSVGVTTATAVTISGTVTDVSAGASQSAVAKNFPNGLPCVSDESQSQWMSYVYQQQTLPLNTTGVPITISVIDANGNYRTIGTTTTVSGTYAFTWTPDILGQYEVIATFDGTNSYYPSSAVAYFYASDAPTPAPTAQMPTGFVTTTELMTYLVVGVIAIIIALAIATLLITRKRP